MATANGLDASGRQKTIDTAKQAVIAINMTAVEQFGAGKYRAKLNLNNLPSQAGLTGAYLYPTTVYPYTSSSPLLATYKAEQINVSCPSY